MKTEMKAVGYQRSLPADNEHALTDITLPVPVASGSDLLVEIKAIAVNPVDTKVRASTAAEQGEWKVLGWDAAGIVRAVGPEVKQFKNGDRVWYAGDLTRQGTNAEFQLVDEQIVGHMPTSLDFASAAALPLTAITAWEMLFERLCLPRSNATSDESLMIIGAAGGVGSILTQLARQLTGLTVIGTASRPQSRQWVERCGANLVIDHQQPFGEQLRAGGIQQVDHVISLTHSDTHLGQVVDVIKPQGKFGLIDDPKDFNIGLLKRKSLSLHWEFMFTRSMFRTADRIAQQHLLNDVADLIDEGVLFTTLGEHYGDINASNLLKAHQKLESGKAVGKIVLEGFSDH